jgi:hypothetical protein
MSLNDALDATESFPIREIPLLHCGSAVDLQRQREINA